MRLIASLIVKNELTRYLELCIQALLEYVDEIRVLDDGSDDGTYEWLLGQERVFVLTNAGSRFFEHEGRARQALLEWTIQGRPTHVLAIDADEFVSDGKQLREVVESDPAVVFTLLMEEVWKTTQTALFVRVDGGWRPHPVPILYHAPRTLDRRWQIQQRALACGREPFIVRNFAVRGKAKETGCSVFHFGWTREAERHTRYARYTVADGGKFHASSHLESIMWPDERVKLQERPWPPALRELRESVPVPS